MFTAIREEKHLLKKIAAGYLNAAPFLKNLVFLWGVDLFSFLYVTFCLLQLSA